MKVSHLLIFSALALSTASSFMACNREDPEKTREEIVLFSDEFDVPNTWVKYNWDSLAYTLDSTGSIFVNGILSLNADESAGCKRQKAERNYRITPSIQEALNTNDTMLFELIFNYASSQSSGQVIGVFQFNDFNLRIDFPNKPSKSTIELILVNWIVKEVKENGVITADYSITTSKSLASESGVIFSTNACNGDSAAIASLGVESFKLSYPKWTIN